MPLSVTTVVGFEGELLLIVTRPVAEPVVVGSNCTVMFIDWPGDNVTGSVAPDKENPVPVTVTEFIVTPAVPVELRVNDCVIGLFSVVLPNEIFVAFTDRMAVAAFN